ncbi:MAG: hypothetical protein KJ556_15960 [Gammaproteobacteria bacterium]|nr:hypothetical protein [Gammaproteobacteria bacterium]MBU2058336.1 hypothetical protein [Gammaproteobacteria bacterium]MBU2176611.1 hypothetical protein [Gammaproteobacteria bacterium]MBU2248447.1 hypothetical protein [Gammaproteobacteria bacterium]MBU2345690.1 hypothetical protein [Gammaproteobacteria bacterium]
MGLRFKQHSFRKSIIHSCVALSICQYPVYAQAQDSSVQEEKLLSIIQRIKKRYDGFEQPKISQQSESVPSSEQVISTVAPPKQHSATIPHSGAFGFTKEPELGERQNNDGLTNAWASDEEEPSEDDSRFMEGEELVVTLFVKDIRISDVIIIKSKTGFLIDLIALIQQLDFSMEMSKNGRILKGWFIKETNQFDINLPAKQGDKTDSMIRGKPYQLTEQHYQLIDDAFYIELDMVQQWFDFQFALEETDLKLVLTSMQPLPIELKKQREATKISSSKAETAVLPFREEGYKAFSIPLFDTQVNQQFNRSGKNTFNSSSYSLIGSGDLSYFTSQFYLNGSKEDALSDARLSLLRESNKSDIGGPLKLTSFEFGDIVPINAGQRLTQGLSLGVRASSLSSGETGNNKTVNLVGEIQDGWDLELYRNSILIDRINNSSGGRYEFNDIELLFGDNNFEIIFYGPQGQVETRQENYRITGNSLAAGDSSYSVSLSKNNTRLFNVAENPDLDQGDFFSSIYRYGFTSWWSGQVGLTYLRPEQEEDDGTVNIGQSFALGNILLGLDYATDKQKNKFFSGNARTQLSGINLGLNYQQANTANDENGLNTDKQYSLTMSGALPFSTPVSYQNNFSVTESADGSKLSRFGNALSARTDLGYFSNSLQMLRNKSKSTITTNFGVHQTDGFSNDDPNNNLETISYTTNDIINGSARYTTTFGRVFAGLSANYSVKPEFELDSVVSNFSYRLSESISSTFALNYKFEQSQIGGRIGLGWQGDSLAIDSYFNYSKKDSYSAGITARFSFGYEKDTGQLFTDKRSLTNGGALAVRVFEDKNLNQKYDKGEPLLENATVRAAQGYRSADTNEYGVAILTALQPGYITDIVVERSSFDDPFLIPSSQGISVQPRRGYVSSYDLPVSSTGEIEGKVYITEIDGQNTPAAYINLSLVNDAGEEVTTSITEYDGYYVFSDILPGKYKIYLDPSYAKRKKLRKAAAMPVKIKGGGELFNASDVILAQLEFKDGYAADLGTFSSLLNLKAYWALIKNTGMNTAKFRPFYALNDENKYELKAAFYPTQKQIEEICARFNARKIACEVKTQGFDL